MSYTPNNEQAEQSVIGALLIDNDSLELISDNLKPGDFYNQGLGSVYKTILELNAKGAEVDQFIIADEIEPDDSRQLGAYLGELILNTPSAANIISYARKVGDKSKEREMIAVHEKSIATIKNGDGSASEKLHHSIANVNAIDPDSNNTTLHSVKMKEIALNWLDSYEHKIDHPEEKGLTLGIDGLDEIIGARGIQPGDVVVIAARPKMMKTATMTKIANHVGLGLKKPVLTFSLEMRNNLMFERALTQETGVTSDNFYRPMGDPNFALVNKAMTDLIPSQMYIDDRSNLTLTQIRSEVRRRAKELGGYGKLGAIMIDYFTLMDLEGDKSNPSYGYAQLSKGIVSLAKEVGCPLFLFSQLNRNCEQRTDKRPMPYDLGDTGQLERDASLIIMLYNDVVYHSDSPMAGLLELIVRVNRNGATGTAYQCTAGGRLTDIGASEIGARLSEAEYQAKQTKETKDW